MSQSHHNHHNHHNHRIPVSFESKQPFEIIKVEVQIHQSRLLGFGVCLQARKVCRDGLQQTDHATRLAGHATVGTGHGLTWPWHAMAWNGLERNTVQPLQPGRRFFASLHQGQATGLVEPQPQKAGGALKLHSARKNKRPNGPNMLQVTRISLDSYETTATSEILPRSPDSFSALMASSTAACAFWACKTLRCQDSVQNNQRVIASLFVPWKSVGFQEMVLSSVKVR